MAVIVIYDENDAVVPDRVTQRLPSANTPDYDQRADVLVNPDESAGIGITYRNWVAVPGSNSIRVMTQQELDDVAAATAAAIDAAVRAEAKNYEGMDGFKLRFRALISIFVDEFNTLRDLHGLPARDVGQLKTVINNRIDSGDAD